MRRILIAVAASLALAACGGGGSGDKPKTTTELVDTDGDGVPDAQDAFPNDASETKDTDSDGVGDVADAFPNDASETKDTDGDGVGDIADAFPQDASETKDTDGDGVGDVADAFPNDASETKDTDGDGVGDIADAFPQDASETMDTDGDGVGDNADAFPNDAPIVADTVKTGGAADDQLLVGTLYDDSNRDSYTVVNYSLVSPTSAPGVTWVTETDYPIFDFLPGTYSPGDDDEYYLSQQFYYGRWSDSQTLWFGGNQYARGGTKRNASFGIGLENDELTPYVRAVSPPTVFGDSPLFQSLSGEAYWEGTLVGLTTDAKQPMGANVDITLQLSELTGRIDYSGLQTIERDGTLKDFTADLRHDIAVRGNTFVKTGGDAGTTTAVFAGERHETIAGTVRHPSFVGGFSAEHETGCCFPLEPPDTPRILVTMPSATPAAYLPRPGTYEIVAGGTLDVNGVRFSCAVSACTVYVANDGAVTARGGMVTAEHTPPLAALLERMVQVPTASEIRRVVLEVLTPTTTAAANTASAIGRAAVARPRYHGAVTQSSNVSNGVTADRVMVTAADSPDGVSRYTARNGTDWQFEFVEDDAVATDSGMLIPINSFVEWESGGEDWHAFGVWMIVPRDRTLAADYVFGAFVDGRYPFSHEKIEVLQGTASYSGSAEGVLSLRSDEGWELADWRADVHLTAEFGGSSDFGTISGSLANIEDEDENTYSGSLSLGTADISSSDGGFFEGRVSGTLAGDSFTGRWGGQFFGTYSSPDEVMGTMGAQNSDGSVNFLGVFDASVEARSPAN